MKKIAFVLISLALLAAGCSKNKTVYNENQKIEKNNWQRILRPTITFEVPITDIGFYNVNLEVRHATHYPFANLLVDIAMSSPDGSSRVIPKEYMLKDETKGFLGDGSGDIWDISLPIFENVNFSEAGIYKFEVDNAMPFFDLPGIMEIGLKVTKAPKEKK